jgi:uncharacterized membrane protein (UPF0127 family)
MHRLHRSTLLGVLLGASWAVACRSHTDSNDTDRYAGIMSFDTATIRLIGRAGRDTTRVVAELAETEPQRTMGLMERRALAPDAGMLFLYSAVQPDSSAFWMFRTRLPLDIAFIDSGGTIRTVLTMEPCPSPLAQGCPEYPAKARYLAALEVSAGFFAREHLGVGDRVVLGDTTSRRKAARKGS